ncbi:hypothetical protein GQ53DRAFT_409436 [Thozetella sp. PMI_491]|nr:hypothetical protein GQ53DRAFT_409436 [Thozetella sp. PMI_491]
MRSSLVWLALVSSAAAASTTNNTCYWIDGSVSTDSFRCDNSTTGHTTCCQAGAVCYSNGVCKVVNSGVQDWQRVGCTDSTWQDPSCLDQCNQYAPSSSAGIRPCDGIDKGNHYCCDPGPYIGSFACCNNSTNIFVLGTSIPTILAQMPLSQLSTSTSTSASSTSSSTSSASNSASTTPGSSGGSDSSSGGSTNMVGVGVGVGLGVGIPVAAAVIGAFWFFSRRSARKAGNSDGTAYDNTSYGGSPMVGNSMPSGSYAQPGYQQAPGNGWGAPASMHSPGNESFGACAYTHSNTALAPNMPKYGGPPPGMPEMSQSNAPVELPDRAAVTELPASEPYKR